MSYCLYCGQQAKNLQADSPFCSHSCFHKHEIEQLLTSSIEEPESDLVQMLYQITQSAYLADQNVALEWGASKLLAEYKDLPPAVSDFLGSIARGNGAAHTVFRFVQGCEPYTFKEETATGA